MKHVNVALFVPHAGCPHKCIFCDQRAISGSCSVLKPFDVKQAAIKAIESGKVGEDSEIAFFGGSFTAIDRDYMVSLLKAAHEFIERGFFSGIRCSTRPDCIDEEILYILKQYGVKNIELGCQSMSDEVLLKNERGHTEIDTVKACNLIRKYDIGLGLQMMTGLYGDSYEGCIQSAKKMAALRPDTIRIYPTLVIKNTRLEQLYKKGLYVPQTLNEAIKLCSELIVIFENMKVKIIRLGLHSGGGLDGSFVAGPYHPAFRELCESNMYLQRLKNIDLGSECIVYAPNKEISKIIGQNKKNIKELRRLGVVIHVKADDSLNGRELKIERM